MAFKSKSSKLQANSSINKLLTSVLPTAQPISLSSRSSSKQNNGSSSANVAIQSLNETFYGLEQASLNPEQLAKLKKKNKLQKKHAIRKNLDTKSRIEKAAKMDIIRKQIHKVNQNKNSKDANNSIGQKLDYQLTAEEKKLINSTIDNNVKLVKSWDKPEDKASELRRLEEEIIALKNEKIEARDARLGKKRVREVKMGASKSNSNGRGRSFAYPGLTPGLAPVGLDDDDEDSE